MPRLWKAHEYGLFAAKAVSASSMGVGGFFLPGGKNCRTILQCSHTAGAKAGAQKVAWALAQSPGASSRMTTAPIARRNFGRMANIRRMARERFTGSGQAGNLEADRAIADSHGVMAAPPDLFGK